MRPKSIATVVVVLLVAIPASSTSIDTLVIAASVVSGCDLGDRADEGGLADGEATGHDDLHGERARCPMRRRLARVLQSD